MNSKMFNKTTDTPLRPAPSAPKTSLETVEALSRDQGDIISVDGVDFVRFMGDIDFQIKAHTSLETAKKVAKKICGLITLEMFYNSQASDKIFKTCVKMMYMECMNSPSVISSHFKDYHLITSKVKMFTKMPCIQMRDLPDNVRNRRHGFCIPESHMGPGLVSYIYSCDFKAISIMDSILANSQGYSSLEESSSLPHCNNTVKELIERGHQTPGFSLGTILPILNLKICIQSAHSKDLSQNMGEWLRTSSRSQQAQQHPPPSKHKKAKKINKETSGWTNKNK